MKQFLRRDNNTAAQSSLSKQQRQKNIKNAFSLTSTPQVSHIALFDDVVTTGATVTELANTLRQQWNGKLEVWAVMRA